MKIQEIVAKNIRIEAKKKGIPLIRLADEAGVSKSQLFAFLKGEKDVTLGWLEKITKVLKVEIKSLF